MIKIAHKRDEVVLKHLPAEVVARAFEIVTILDDNYGETREGDHDLGGYVLVVEIAEDVETIKKLIDFGYTLPEYVDLICVNGENYTSSLMLLSSDYSISLLIPRRLTPKELLIYLEE